MQRLLRLFFFVRTIPAIVLYFVIQNKLGPWNGALIATSYALLYTGAAFLSRRVTRIDYGMVLFWVAGLFSAGLSSNGIRYFTDHFTTFLYFSLFLAVFFPMTLGAEPFTLQFSRDRTPKELWNTDQFITINRIMSYCWTVLFLIAAALTLLPTLWFKFVIPLGGMIFIGIPLNRYFPDFYLNREQKRARTFTPPLDISVSKMKSSASAGQPGINGLSNADRENASQRPGRIEKAIVIFGSPRGEKGYTFQLLSHFLSGLQAGGVDYQLVSLATKKIKPCSGCFSCWTKTPGRCIHQDDMDEIMEDMKKADLVIYAQPLYVFSVPGITKNFLDRLLPRLQPYLVEGRDGETRHPLRWPDQTPSRMCIFSVCGFPEVSHFQPMLDMFRAMAANGGSSIVGEILRPASESLLFGKRYGEQYEQLNSDLNEAGRQIASQGYVQPALEARISRPFIQNMEGFRQIANRAWDTMLEYEEKIKLGEELPPRTEYLLQHPRLLFGGMASLYDPAKADGLHGTIRFDLTDHDQSSYTLQINSKGCICKEEKIAQPDLIIQTPLEVWQAISHGELSGMEAYRKGEYRATGDLSLLMKLREAMA